jgi:hypothetical protein
MKRARLSKAERAAMWQAQDGKCAICGEPMLPGQRIDEEHSIPIALGGPGKPDRLVHAEPCHRTKTSGTRATTAGSDVQRIAKVKRIQKKGRLGGLCGLAKPRSKRAAAEGLPRRFNRQSGGPQNSPKRPISAHNGRVIASRPFKRPPYESPWPRAAERQE